MTNDEIKALIAAMKKDGDLKPLHGVAGPQGPEGKLGPQGPQGDTGAKGNLGAQGAPGDRGPEGKQGPRGDRGEAGQNGAVGSQGFQGNTGARGNAGDRGEMGPQGSQGNPGARGAQGDVGQAGVTGANYSCRATSKQHLTLNPGEWTTIYFDADNWDSLGNFHSTTSNTEYLSVSMQGTYRVEAVVDGVNKLRIMYIDANGKETPVVNRSCDSGSTLWKCVRGDKFRVEVQSNQTFGIQPNQASPVFIIQKVDKCG